MNVWRRTVTGENMRMRNKRGSLELSANAIVILIIAITILGLGLGFVKNLFGSLAEKIGLQAETIDFSEPPTPDRPITMVGNLELARGGQKQLTIGFYNNKNCGLDPTPSVVPTFQSCVGSSATGTGLLWSDPLELPHITATPAVTKCGQTAEYLSIIAAGEGMALFGDTICTVKVDIDGCTEGTDCLADIGEGPTTVQLRLTIP